MVQNLQPKPLVNDGSGARLLPVDAAEKIAAGKASDYDSQLIRRAAQFALWGISPARSKKLGYRLERPDFNFSVWVPSQPKIEKIESGTSGADASKTTTFASPEGTSPIFGVNVVDSERWVKEFSHLTLEKQYQALIRDMLNNPNAELLFQARVERSGLVGWNANFQIKGEKASVILIMRFYVVGQRVYRLVVSQLPEVPVHPSCTDHFFNSFRLLKMLPQSVSTPQPKTS